MAEILSKSNPDKWSRPYRRSLTLDEFAELVAQTPKSVWEEYEAEGYSLRQAVYMELSYV